MDRNKSRDERLILQEEFDAFSYAVSHDLRAPLRAIDGFSAILEEDFGAEMDGEALRLLHVIRENSRKMGEMMDDLLLYSRLGRQEIRPGPVDLEREAIQILDSLRKETEREVALATATVPAAWGDRLLLREALKQLLENALKFVRPEQKIVLRLEGGERDRENRYSLRDNGVGFDDRYKDNLFRAFHRLHGEKDFPGTGMGLAIVRNIVQRHGGRVWAEGTPGRGAVFSFSLPRPPQEEAPS